MDAVRDYKELDKLIKELLKRRKDGSDFDDALIEDAADFMLGHLNQINAYILIVGDRLDGIKKKKDKKKDKKK